MLVSQKEGKGDRDKRAQFSSQRDEFTPYYGKRDRDTRACDRERDKIQRRENNNNNGSIDNNENSNNNSQQSIVSSLIYLVMKFMLKVNYYY